MSGDNVGKGPFAIVIMGPSGAGKSTIGALLATRLNYEFIDADDYHPANNVEKMARGQALSDLDRKPWLESLSHELRIRRAGPGVVLACSALKATYRSILRRGNPELRLIHLEVPKVELVRRLNERGGHFAKVDLLESQLASLEAPSDEDQVNACRRPEAIIDDLLSMLVRDSKE